MFLIIFLQQCEGRENTLGSIFPSDLFGCKAENEVEEWPMNGRPTQLKRAGEARHETEMVERRTVFAGIWPNQWT